MISIEESLPKRSKRSLKGQDILWTQFNDVNFYVEGIEQENFYFEILKKLFPKIKFERIFPLGGKPNILADAALNNGDKKKVYIVDLDFDDILNCKHNNNNIFYLERYSIENYLLDLSAIKKIIIEEKPKIKNHEIDSNLNINSFFNECHTLYSDLVKYYIVIQKHELGIENVKCDPARFCNYTVVPATIKEQQVTNYRIQLEALLAAKDARLRLSSQMNQLKRYFSTIQEALKHIPGKYLLNFIKYRIEHLFKIAQMTLESFTYRLAKNCTLEDLFYLRQRIVNYIQ